MANENEIDGVAMETVETSVIMVETPTGTTMIPVVDVPPGTVITGPVVDMQAMRELPPEVADEVGRFVDPRCARCDCSLRDARSVATGAGGHGLCARCFQDESTENAVGELAELRESHIVGDGRDRLWAVISRVMYGVKVLQDRARLAERAIGGPPLVGNQHTPGKRYIRLIPVRYQRTREIIGWKVDDFLGQEQLYLTPQAASGAARRGNIGPADVRVLEVDILNLPDVDLTPEQRREHAERMEIRWSEEHRLLRMGAVASPGTAIVESALGMPVELRTMALRAQRDTGATSHLCLQCTQNLKEHGLPFCVPCARDVLDKLGRAVSAAASAMGQMEVVEPPPRPAVPSYVPDVDDLADLGDDDLADVETATEAEENVPVAADAPLAPTDVV